MSFFQSVLWAITTGVTLGYLHVIERRTAKTEQEIERARVYAECAMHVAEASVRATMAANGWDHFETQNVTVLSGEAAEEELMREMRANLDDLPTAEGHDD